MVILLVRMGTKNVLKTESLALFDNSRFKTTAYCKVRIQQNESDTNKNKISEHCFIIKLFDN